LSPGGKKDRGDPELRAEAKTRLGAASAVKLAPGAPVFEAAHQPAEKLVHELQVYQIELEMQNETLRQSLIALEESHDRYAEFYDFAPVGYLTLDEKGLIVEINLTGAAMLGADRAKLLQASFGRFVAAEDRDRWHRHFVKALQPDAKLNSEVALLRQDGTRLDVRLDSLRLAKDSKAPTLRVVLTDVSAKKISQTALHRSEEFRIAVLDSLSSQVAVLDPDGVIVAVNEPWRRFALENGTEPGDPAGKTGIGVNYLHVCQASRGDSADEARQAHDGIRLVLDGRLPSFHLEYPCHTPNQQRWFNMLVTPLNTQERGAVIVHTDISKRKRAEQALVESEERFGLFMDTLPAAAFIKDRESTIVYTNRYSAEIIGAQPGLGKSNRDIFPSELAEKMIADDHRAIEDGNVITEEWIPGRDGEPRLYETRKFTIPRKGKPALIGGISIDITERKRAEEQLREMAASLEAKVTERTQELRRLAGQLTLTEERERNLLAQDLHDNLGQLLAVIKIKLTSLVVGSLDSSINQIVGLVDKAEQSAREITLELSPPILHTLGLLPALEWLVDEMKRIYGMRVHLDDEHPPQELVSEIQAMLYRSVRELLINVAKHANVSDATLYCHCDGTRLTLVVSDDGCGFDPTGFHDGVPRQGTFGLNSIYERITNIGGQMEIDSSPGNGTAVTLTVPCSIAAKENQP
jgi:PAS domain S-box-containing protein